MLDLNGFEIILASGFPTKKGFFGEFEDSLFNQDFFRR